MYQVYTLDVIDVFQNMFTTNRDVHSHDTRQSDHYNTPLCHINIGKSSICYRGAIIWNNVLKTDISLDCSKMVFINQMKALILSGLITDQLH